MNAKKVKKLDISLCVKKVYSAHYVTPLSQQCDTTPSDNIILAVSYSART